MCYELYMVHPRCGHSRFTFAERLVTCMNKPSEAIRCPRRGRALRHAEYLFESETGKFTDTTDFDYVNDFEEPSVTTQIDQNRRSPSYCENCIAGRSKPLNRQQAKALFKDMKWWEYGDYVRERMKKLKEILKRNGGSDSESIGDSTLGAVSSIDEYMADAMASSEDEQTTPTKEKVKFQDNVAEQLLEADTLKAIQNSIKDQRVNPEDLQAQEKSITELSKHAEESSDKLKENHQDVTVQSVEVVDETDKKLKESDRILWSSNGQKRRVSL